ncbi:glycosyltransferase involved in cell wall biosynthesis [Epilithonimonas hungarica]|uniref:glycosyltransferase n=1 Tax=Epilithonimonas hungarica TaxID=454006 RepID=UPI002783FC4B|nr:glycosyltransferase [Epilithonimonas hungarica]MDP9956823.1 glycosyltransferase involved in cell wall biosynthesis [Epilithonimonas hungarica]
MKNILLIMPYGSVGGMERLAKTFYDNYKSQGYDVKAVKIIGLENDIINFGQDEYILSNIDFSGLSPLQRTLFYFKIPFLLKRIIKKNKIDISIAFGDMANCFSAITGTNEKKIASFHAVKSIEFKNNAGISKFFKWSIHNTYKKFDKVVAISHAIKKDLIENCGYSFSNLQVIYNPHDSATIIEKSKDVFSENEKKYVEKDFIVFLGRLSVQKAPWHLIKAFSLIKDDFPDLRLLMIGDGDARVEKFTEELVEHLKLQNRVVFLGRRTNPYKYLKKARCLALSSLYEGTPNVIVEAMILNVPIITTNCTDGISEMVIHQIKQKEKEFLITDAGVITEDILNSNKAMLPLDFEIKQKDSRYAKALKYVLDIDNNNKFRNNDKTNMLKKYNIKDVLKDYLA